MITRSLISANEFCVSHNIDLSFIRSLDQTGLIEVRTIEDSEFIPLEQLKQLEKFVRLYFDLEINIEGIEAITYLLERMNDMQEEINSLKNRLCLYEQYENQE
jgi:hypothetical protein